MKTPINRAHFNTLREADNRVNFGIRAAPKRGVGGSNPLMDAIEYYRKPLFIEVFGFFFIRTLTIYQLIFAFLANQNGLLANLRKN